MGSKAKAPKAPDYAALAAQQGIEERQTANFNTALNRANQVGPDGTLTWTVRPGADPLNPQAGDWTQTVALSPEQQALYDAQTGISQSYLDTAQAGLGRVGDAMAQEFSLEGLPGLSGAPSVQQNAVAARVNPSGTSTQFDSSGVRTLPGQVDDTSRQRVEEALLSRLEPQFQRDQTDLTTTLLNSGIERGSAGWNREMDRLDRAKNDARMQAVLAGGAEESRQVGLNQGLQGQEFGQALTSQQFGNAGVGQDFAQRMASQGQEFSQQSAIDSLLNAFGLSAAGLNNDARQQGIQEQAYLRSIPLNETNALRTGAQVNMPNFGGYYTGGGANAAPIMDAGIAQGNYDMAAYQQKMAGQNALLGGLANMGSAWILS